MKIPKPQSVVAVILALTVLIVLVGGMRYVLAMLGVVPEQQTVPTEMVAAYENLMFALIGGLTGYISGGRKDD